MHKQHRLKVTHIHIKETYISIDPLCFVLLNTLAVKRRQKSMVIILCVCVCVLWICPLLVEKAVTEVALMYLPTLQPTNKHCRQTCLCLLDDGSAVCVRKNFGKLPALAA